MVVGTGTVLADDPQLTARRADGTLLPGQPLRVVVGRRDLPRSAQVLDPCGPDPRVDACRSAGPSRRALRPQHPPRAAWRADPLLAAAFLQADLVDRVVAYVGPKMLGSGLSLIGSLGAGSMSQARRVYVRRRPS